jgi:hypothetical protein
VANQPLRVEQAAFSASTSCQDLAGQPTRWQARIFAYADRTGCLEWFKHDAKFQDEYIAESTCDCHFFIDSILKGNYKA